MTTTAPPTGGGAVAPDGTTFRRAAGRIPSAVSIITGQGGTTRLGLTVATLTPVSNEPPMLQFLAARTSVTAAAIVATGAFGVTVLARGQEAECYRFATSGGDKFAGLEVDAFPSGLPRIPGGVFAADCVIESTVPAGDHLAVFGRVLMFDAATSAASPLVFYRSKVARLDAASGRHIPTESLSWW